MRSLLPVAADTISPFPPHVAVDNMSKMIPHVAYPGSVQTASTRGLQFSDAAIEVLAKYAATMPPTALLIGMHVLHGVSTEGAGPPNVFRNREAHSMIEILGVSGAKEDAEESGAWAEAFGREMRAAEGALEGTYMSLTAEDTVDLGKIYGEKLDRLLELKRKFDPENVFKNAVPRLNV